MTILRESGCIISNKINDDFAPSRSGKVIYWKKKKIKPVGIDNGLEVFVVNQMILQNEGIAIAIYKTPFVEIYEWAVPE